MKSLLQAAVLLLMLAVGISLRPGQIWNNWRRLTPSKWARLIAATFLLPAGTRAGAWKSVRAGRAGHGGIVPDWHGAGGAAHDARRGATGVRCAHGGELPGVREWIAYAGHRPIAGRDGRLALRTAIWVPPMKLLSVIAQQQFLPLLVGMALTWLAPAISSRMQRALVPIGNILILVVLVAVLYKMGPALEQVDLCGWRRRRCFSRSDASSERGRCSADAPRSFKRYPSATRTATLVCALLLSGQQNPGHRPVQQ